MIKPFEFPNPLYMITKPAYFAELSLELQGFLQIEMKLFHMTSLAGLARFAYRGSLTTGPFKWVKNFSNQEDHLSPTNRED